MRKDTEGRAICLTELLSQKLLSVRMGSHLNQFYSSTDTCALAEHICRSLQSIKEMGTLQGMITIE